MKEEKKLPNYKYRPKYKSLLYQDILPICPQSNKISSLLDNYPLNTFTTYNWGLLDIFLSSIQLESYLPTARQTIQYQDKSSSPHDNRIFPGIYSTNPPSLYRYVLSSGGGYYYK